MQRSTLIGVVAFALTAAALARASTADARQPPRGMPLCAENETLGLYVDAASGEFVVWDKRHATAWYSTPPDRASDPLANEWNRGLLGSLLRAEITTSRDQLVELNSRTNSVERRLCSVAMIPGGFRVEYRMSNHRRGESEIPVAIEKSRFERRFLARLDADGRAAFQERFELDETGRAYVRRSIPPFEVDRYLELLDRIGYTAAELAEDAAAMKAFAQASRDELRSRVPGIRVESLASRDEVEVVVPIECRLEGPDVVVEIDASRIACDGGSTLSSLEVLRFFGAAGSDESGYLLVPDGSGALVYFNNRKQRYPPIRLPVYGDQESETRRERLSESPPVYLPVFGLKSGRRAFLAVIERGDAIATINADVSGRLHSYNSVGAEFRLTEQGRATIGSGDRSRSRLVFQKTPYRGAIRIRYSFLSDGEADYLGMANRLQDYLRDVGVLRPAVGREPVLNVQLLGAIDLSRTFAGLSLRRVQALTTYDQVLEVADRLLAGGVEDVRIRYKGWMERGVRHRFVSTVSLEPALGGPAGFRRMLDGLQRRGVPLWPEVSVGVAWSGGGGFAIRKDAERYLDQSVARMYAFNLSTLQMDRDEPAGYYVAPARLATPIAAAVDFARRNRLDGVVLGDIGSQLRADYRDGAECDRERASALLRTALRDVAGGVGHLAVSGANLPVLGSVDQLFDVPFISSGNSLYDHSIPFLQLVLRGCVRFAGEPLNLAADYRDLFLHTLETGADVQVTWTYAESSALKNTSFDRYYATQYEASLDLAVELYRELREVWSKIGGSRLVRHRWIQPAAAELVFDGGLVLVINYDRRMMLYHGQPVNAQDYLLVEGERLGRS